MKRKWKNTKLNFRAIKVNECLEFFEMNEEKRFFLYKEKEHLVEADEYCSLVNFERLLNGNNCSQR